MKDQDSPASAAWQDVTPIEAMDDGGYVYFLYNAKKVDTARAADAQQIADWQQRAERQYDENVSLIAKGAEQEQQIAALRAERERLDRANAALRQDWDQAASRLIQIKRELLARAEAAEAQLTALQAKANELACENLSLQSAFAFEQHKCEALQAEQAQWQQKEQK